MDLLPPRHADPVPDRAEGVLALDHHARLNLDVRNVDHILAGMEAGLIQDAIVVARTRLPGAAEKAWVDRRGKHHALLTVPRLEALTDGFGTETPSEQARAVAQMLEKHAVTLLDVDLDCFTTVSDADPTSVVPWPEELIRAFLMPEGSPRFWDAVLLRCAGLTVACEPYHCGGLVAAHRLFERVATVLFREILAAEMP
jgi:hypothetical protein